jgi:hypothetical protein
MIIDDGPQTLVYEPTVTPRGEPANSVTYAPCGNNPFEPERVFNELAFWAVLSRTGLEESNPRHDTVELDTNNVHMNEKQGATLLMHDCVGTKTGKAITPRVELEFSHVSPRRHRALAPVGSIGLPLRAPST